MEVRVAVGVHLCQQLEPLVEHLGCQTLGLQLLLGAVRCVVLTVPVDQIKKIHAKLFALIDIEAMLVNQQFEQRPHGLIWDLAIPNDVDQRILRVSSTRLHRIHIEVLHGQEGFKDTKLSGPVGLCQCLAQQVIMVLHF